tara:strand:+ start:4958 stop:6148 length:1191 start_codon:yes stop_codon:yes gene_type:complete
MITLDEALSRIAGALLPVSSEQVGLGDAFGRILAKPLVAERTQPPFSASAMDGYAVRSADLTGQTVRFQVTGESAAGHATSRPVGAGEAFRVSTGAPMPDGADQVVIQENCTREESDLITAESPASGKNIRKAGIDFTEGALLLDAGQALSPAAVSLAASAGHAALSVMRRPRVGILSTGDELVEAGQDTRPDQIINSLAPALTGLVREWGGEPVYLGIARDNADDVRARLSATADLDLGVTIGGASVGDHDHLRRVFSDLGGELVFEKIAIKPGKPTWFGKLGTTPIVGLPGNPVSALVMARLCLKPAMDHMLGIATPTVFRAARLSVDLPANGPRENMVRARIDSRTGEIAPLANQDSSALSALVASNGLIRRPAGAAPARAGDTVEYLPLGPQ